MQQRHRMLPRKERNRLSGLTYPIEPLGQSGIHRRTEPFICPRSNNRAIIHWRPRLGEAAASPRAGPCEKPQTQSGMPVGARAEGRVGQSVRKRSRPRPLSFLPLHASFPLVFPLLSSLPTLSAAPLRARIKPPWPAPLRIGLERLHERNMNATKNAPAGASSVSFFAGSAGVAPQAPNRKRANEPPLEPRAPKLPDARRMALAATRSQRPTELVGKLERRRRRTPIFNLLLWPFFPFLSLFLCVFCRHA